MKTYNKIIVSYFAEIFCVCFFVPEKHRGFAFVEFELQEDAAAAMDNMVYL